MDKVFLLVLLFIIALITVGCESESNGSIEKVQITVSKIECRWRHPAVGVYSLHCEYQGEVYVEEVNLKELNSELKSDFWSEDIKPGDKLYCRLNINSEGNVFFTDFSSAE